MKAPLLTIVVPCYNEEEVLPETFTRLNKVMEEMIEHQLISNNSKILYVDDGSSDRTWQFIFKETIKNQFIRGLKLAKNSGHQNALLAGIFAAKKRSDCIVSIDADLQDDVETIKEFVQKFREGYDIVYGVRKKRKTDTFFKRHTAQLFYRLMGLFGVQLVYNHADFRLLSKRAVEALVQFKEVNLFLRGLIPLLGFKSTVVEYERKERMHGVTKYPLKKMISFALDGITSFSIVPIRMVTTIGLLSFFISTIAAFYFLYEKFYGSTELGWTSLILSIWFIGGLQLIAIGIVGEYIGKIYKEVKNRPKYIVEIDTFNLPLATHQDGVSEDGPYSEVIKSN